MHQLVILAALTTTSGLFGGGCQSGGCGRPHLMSWCAPRTASHSPCTTYVATGHSRGYVSGCSTCPTAVATPAPAPAPAPAAPAPPGSTARSHDAGRSCRTAGGPGRLLLPGFLQLPCYADADVPHRQLPSSLRASRRAVGSALHTSQVRAHRPCADARSIPDQALLPPRKRAWSLTHRAAERARARGGRRLGGRLLAGPAAALSIRG